MPAVASDFIALLRRTCPEAWIEPLLADPDSAAIINAWATMAEREATAVETTRQAGLISEAQPGIPGASNVSVSRASTGTNTIPAGTLFEDARGAKYTTDVDIPLVPGAFALATFAVHTLRKSESVNTVDDPDMRFSPVFFVADAENTTPIKIHTTTKHGYVNGNRIQVKGVLGNTAANGHWTVANKTDFTFDLTSSAGNGLFTSGGIVYINPFNVDIVSSTPTANGASDWLSVHGAERGQLRQAGEVDGDYRARVRNITDAVAPRGILETVNGVAQRVMFPQLLMIEPFRSMATQALLDDIGIQSLDTLYLSPNTVDQTVGTSLAPLPYAWDELVSRILGFREARAYFQLEPVATPASVLALPITWDSASQRYLIGGNTTQVPGVAAIQVETDRRKPAAVQWDFLIPYIKEFYIEGVATPPTTGVWTATPPAGKIWWFLDLAGSHVKQQVGVLPADRSHTFRFTFEDATTYDTTSFFGLCSERVTEAAVHAATGSTKRVSSIRGSLGGTGGVAFNLIAVIRVLEVPI